ncbi:hypothetical protein [Maliponia aquimaris]|uniref:hypothetical protein n=1 Tax=Maliponia aquimaris TaxID=1673631 RepID=UPI00114007CA|nr:hypothetical protein [Maliponia aquimaris]
MNWLKRLFSGHSAPKKPSLEIIINEYGKVLGEGGSVERDVRELPFSKEVIKEGLLEALKLTTDPTMRGHLESAFISLADFQDLKALADHGVSAPKTIAAEAEQLLFELRGVKKKLPQAYRPGWSLTSVFGTCRPRNRTDTRRRSERSHPCIWHS